ncbi:hypothetical protein JCM17843_15240 [Kordiimonadales bacterium JCM 17843]|nr:hypothetical protein JCM17843_15240 [Kordiimonadales bacterium JCM 17843]
MQLSSFFFIEKETIVTETIRPTGKRVSSMPLPIDNPEHALACPIRDWIGKRMRHDRLIMATNIMICMTGYWKASRFL